MPWRSLKDEAPEIGPAEFRRANLGENPKTSLEKLPQRWASKRDIQRRKHVPAMLLNSHLQLLVRRDERRGNLGMLHANASPPLRSGGCPRVAQKGGIVVVETNNQLITAYGLGPRGKR